MKLAFGPDDYNPFQLRQKDQKDVRQEYTRLRRIAIKRLRRIEAAGLSSPSLANYIDKTYKPVSQIKSNAGVRAALSAVHKWLQSESSSVKGQRQILKRALSNFDFYGIKWVTPSNIYMVRQFLDSAKAGAYGENIGSPEALDYLVTLKTEAETIDELEKGYEKWLLRDTKYGNKK